MFKHLPLLGAVWPVTAGLWFIHPTTSTAMVAGVTGAAALAEAKLRTMVTAHKEGKAAKAAAKEAAKEEAKAVKRAAKDYAPTALPPARGATISYTAANARQHKRLA